MPKRFFKRITPDHHRVRSHRHLQVFGRLLHDPNLFHLNRRSVAGAFGVGLFMAFVPVPFQMVLAAAAAIVVRVNLPLSVALVWITNPVTMPAVFYGAYRLGAWILGSGANQFRFELSLAWFTHELVAIWQPLLLGCFIAGSLSALLGYGAVRLIWRWRVIREYRARRRQRGMARPQPQNTSK